MNEESDADLTSNAAVTKMDTPDIPEIPDSPSIVSTPIVPEIPEHAQTVSTTPPQVTTPSVPDVPEVPEVTSTPEIPDVPEVPEATSTPEVPDVPEKEVVKTVTDEQPNQAIAPTPQHNGRIWPWPAKQPWDERQVYREVVSMLESVKSGKLVQTAQTLDNLGPHLSINLEMLIHIGTVMRYLGREEHLQWMLKMAQTVYPNDERVTSAIAHLSN